MDAFDLDDLDEVEVADCAPKQVNTAVPYFKNRGAKNIFWYCKNDDSWLKQEETQDSWLGWSVKPLTRTACGVWEAWSTTLDETDPPFYRWFSGGLTNAAFNEVDIHVLEGRGDQLAYIEEPDSAIVGDTEVTITRHDLLVKSAAAAQVLQSQGLGIGERAFIYMPAGIAQIIWVEACKRLGVIYCCCNPALPVEQIADRIFILKATIVITVEHTDWSYSVHEALNTYVPVREALDLARELPSFDQAQLEARWSCRYTVSLSQSPFTGSQIVGSNKNPSVKILTVDAGELPVNVARAKMVKPEEKAKTTCISELVLPAVGLQGVEAVAEVWRQCGAPVPVEANFPLFIIFTSGTTGKPKGVVHTHGYVVGLVETMRVSFNADPTDRMLTIGGLGWITGQSYQICAVLISGVTSVIMRGNPIHPKRSRFAQVINKHNVTILKAGSAFLRDIMSSAQAVEEVRAASPQTLKVATFCAEPVSAAVQKFAMEAVCSNYINSYWATEHGGMVWSRRFKDAGQELLPNAHSWPMTWIDSDVYRFEEAPNDDGHWHATPAAPGDQGDVVILNSYPYMFRYVWGDVENFGSSGWVGDRETMLKKYWRQCTTTGKQAHWAYIQGDFAKKQAHGAYTFHGRSDEVLNVNGILFGTEHIEAAILRDKELNPNSRVGQCIVVGYPDEIAGEVPLAFVTTDDSQLNTGTIDVMRLFNLITEIVGSVQVHFVQVQDLPKTFSGKFLRRTLRQMARGEELGDLSSIGNPGCIEQIRKAVAAWRDQMGY